MSNKNDHDIYIIPPNFIETGTFFGGMFRARNVIEAGVLAFAIGAPVFVFLPFGLTTRIIALCLRWLWWPSLASQGKVCRSFWSLF